MTTLHLIIRNSGRKYVGKIHPFFTKISQLGYMTPKIDAIIWHEFLTAINPIFNSGAIAKTTIFASAFLYSSTRIIFYDIYNRS